MPIQFQQVASFERTRLRIEDFIFNSVLRFEMDAEKALKSVQAFNDSLDRSMDTLRSMYQTPQENDSFGEKFLVIHNGQYRVFYKIVRTDTELRIVFLDIDDNRESNLDRFPTHQLIVFDDEEG